MLCTQTPIYAHISPTLLKVQHSSFSSNTYTLSFFLQNWCGGLVVRATDCRYEGRSEGLSENRYGKVRVQQSTLRDPGKEQYYPPPPPGWGCQSLAWLLPAFCLRSTCSHLYTWDDRDKVME